MNRRSHEITYKNFETPLGSPVLAILDKIGTPEDFREPDLLHFHKHMEIGFCYYGNGVMILDDQKIPYGSNTFAVIPRGISHLTKSHDKIGYSWEYLFIDVDGLVSEVYKDNPPMAKYLLSRINSHAFLSRADRQPEIASLIRQILDVMRRQEELYLEEARGLAFALLICLARQNTDGSQLPGYRHSVNSNIVISPALVLINNEPGQPFKISELAKICHISETHFRRVFSEYMKMSPVKYINQVRIRQACDDLKRSNDSINVIAARSGFPSLSTFNRNFRQITGVTPQQLRKHPDLYVPDAAFTPPSQKLRWLILHSLCLNMATQSHLFMIQCTRLVYKVFTKYTFCPFKREKCRILWTQ